LKTERNPLDSVNVALTVNGVQGPWLLDTGANLSVVSKSFAERLGLKFLPGVAQAQGGLTGIENPLRVALLPTLQMGGASLQRFHSGSKAWEKSKIKIPGAGGVVKRKIYIQPQVKLGIGDKTVTLERVPIHTSGTGTDIADLYGNLGQDVVANFESFTLDFSTMTFSLGKLLAPDKANPKQ
jgi:hypothetical protein